MKLVELIPGAQTDGDATDTLADFLGGELGKGVVFAKDTVNFIAIGSVASGCSTA